jgi:glycosyltransferase involved in cell wall biosynthesis
VIALPFRASDFVESTPANNRPVRVAFLGMGHRSKGLDLVLQALELSASLVEENKLQFAIQLYLPFRDAPSERLHRDIKVQAEKVAGVEVIDRELSPTEYLHQVTLADIVLVPNRLDTYKFAISGVFADAMGAGRPVIVADGSYVSELVRESGAGVLFEDGNGLSLQRAIVEAAGRIEELLDRAKAARLRWVQEQGPEAFVTRLLQLQKSPVASVRG